MNHFYTYGDLSIRAQKEDDGYYHLYSVQLGYLDDYVKGRSVEIKRFRSLTVGRKQVIRFLNWYRNRIEIELAQLEK